MFDLNIRFKAFDDIYSYNEHVKFCNNAILAENSKKIEECC